MPAPAEDLVSRLAAFLSDTAGAPAEVTAVKPIAGGASLETWAVDATVGGEPYALVLRMDLASNMNPNALTRSQEFALLGINADPIVSTEIEELKREITASERELRRLGGRV